MSLKKIAPTYFAVLTRSRPEFLTGPAMYKLTWITQYVNLSIANVGTIILCGQALKVITTDT